MTKLTEADLLPCKFCGESDFEIFSTGYEYGMNDWIFTGVVRCRNCERMASDDGVHHKDAQQAAMRAWNKMQEATE